MDLSIDIRRGKRDKNAAGKWRTLRGTDGSVVWEVAEAAYHSPHIVLGDLIIDRSGISYDLATGRRRAEHSQIRHAPQVEPHDGDGPGSSGKRAVTTSKPACSMLGLAIAVLVRLCGREDAARAAEPVTFERVVLPILNSHCLPCHGGLHRKKELDLIGLVSRRLGLRPDPLPSAE